LCIGNALKAIVEHLVSSSDFLMICIFNLITTWINWVCAMQNLRCILKLFFIFTGYD